MPIDFGAVRAAAIIRPATVFTASISDIILLFFGDFSINTKKYQKEYPVLFLILPSYAHGINSLNAKTVPD